MNKLAPLSLLAAVAMLVLAGSYTSGLVHQASATGVVLSVDVEPTEPGVQVDTVGAEEGRQDGGGPTAAVTVVAPVVITVISEESIVTAGTGMAEAVTMAEEALADETAHPGSMRAGFQGTPIPASPIATIVIVPPSTSTAEPREIVVTPETGLAGAQSEELPSDVNNGGPPFAAIGIAAGVGVAGIVLAVGVFTRVVRGRPRAD